MHVLRKITIIISFPGSTVVRIHLPMQETQEILVLSLGWLGRFPGVGNGNCFQYSSLKNTMNRRTLWAMIHGVTKNQT